MNNLINKNENRKLVDVYYQSFIYIATKHFKMFKNKIKWASYPFRRHSFKYFRPSDPSSETPRP